MLPGFENQTKGSLPRRGRHDHGSCERDARKNLLMQRGSTKRKLRKSKKKTSVREVSIRRPS